MSPEEKRRRNRIAIGIANAEPTPDIFSGNSGRRRVLATDWPCKKDHHPDNIHEYADGTLRCKRCDAEKRQRNREQNPEREEIRNAERRETYYDDPEEMERRKVASREANRKFRELERLARS